VFACVRECVCVRALLFVFVLVKDMGMNKFRPSEDSQLQILGFLWQSRVFRSHHLCVCVCVRNPNAKLQWISFPFNQ